MVSNQVYVGSPLINKEHRDEKLSERIGEILTLKGFRPYIPHLNTQHPDSSKLSNLEIYKQDKKAVLDSIFCIFDVSNGSHGVGMEIEICSSNEKPHILLKKKGGKALSKMVLGQREKNITHIHIIEYDDTIDLLNKLKLCIECFRYSLTGQFIDKYKVPSRDGRPGVDTTSESYSDVELTGPPGSTLKKGE